MGVIEEGLGGGGVMDIGFLCIFFFVKKVKNC